MFLCSCSMISMQNMHYRGEFGEMEIRDGWFYLEGEKFLVVGVGYEIGARPGRVPWDHEFRPDLLHADFKRIRDAGFNAIRCWAPMTDEELDVAAKYGLWVIQGLWIDPKGDFNNPDFRRNCVNYIESEIKRLSKHPNILGYLLMNEPHGKAVFEAGVEEFRDFLHEIAKAARKADSERPFSFSNCVYTDFLNLEEFPFIAHNAYPYSPVTIEKALGYRGYLEYLKKEHAGNKPLIITEFGLSVSPLGDGRGYGGNSLEEQKEGVLKMWGDILDSGATGGCVFMWIDGWWKHENPNKHDPHAEEWYGLLSADEDFMGTPRPVYHAMKDYNRFITVNPKNGVAYKEKIPIEIWGPEMVGVYYRINGGQWKDIPKRGKWWWKRIEKTSALKEGWCEMEIRGVKSGGDMTGSKKIDLLINQTEKYSPPLKVEIITPKSKYPINKPIDVKIRVTDPANKPVAGIKLRVERFIHTGWNEYGTETITGKDGIASATLPPVTEPAIISIAAGTAPPDNRYGRRFGDYVHLKIRR